MKYTNATYEEMIKDLQVAHTCKLPFSVNSLGDAEQIFLACPEIAEIPHLEKYLSISGVKPSDVILKKDIIRLLPENDYVFSHPLRRKETDTRVQTTDWGKFFYMYPEILKHYGIEGLKIITTLADRYQMVASGELFDMLSGAKVLLVGYHAPAIFERTKHKKFVQHYEKMNLHKIQVVGAVGCSEFSNLGSEAHKMLKEIEEYDFQVALLGMGIASHYLGPQIKRMGKISLDVGHILTAFAGEGEKQRMHIEKFDFDESLLS